jgi:hypothetical protein
MRIALDIQRSKARDTEPEVLTFWNATAVGRNDVSPGVLRRGGLRHASTVHAGRVYNAALT